MLACTITYKTNNSAGTKIQTTDRSCKLVANSSAIHRAGCELIPLDAAHVTARAYYHSDGGACASAAKAVEGGGYNYRKTQDCGGVMVVRMGWKEIQHQEPIDLLIIAAEMG